MRNKSLTGADFLLLLLYLNNKEAIRGAVRLVKMMFLFDKEVSKKIEYEGIAYENPPEFIPYDFGPFSKDLYEQVELFSGINFIKVTDLYKSEEMGEIDNFYSEMIHDEEDPIILNESDKKFYIYEIADKGIEYVKAKILGELNDGQIEYLSKFKKRITDSTVKEILLYVYSTYPDTIKKSKIKKEILGHD
jgi:hypothetical protein